MKKWIAGLLASVLSGVLIFWLTEVLRKGAEPNEHYEAARVRDTEEKIRQDEKWKKAARLAYAPIDDRLNRIQFYVEQWRKNSLSEEMSLKMGDLLVETVYYAKKAMRKSQGYSVSAEIVSAKAQYEYAMGDMVRAVAAIHDNKPDEFLYLLESFNKRMRIVDHEIGI